MSIRRSFLYIPGNNASMMSKLPVLKPDAILFDLEDAVAPQDKLPARYLIAAAAKNMGLVGKRCFGVRINGLTTEYWEKDLEVVMSVKPDYIVLPKTETKEDVAVIGAKLAELEEKYGYEIGSTDLAPILETPLGVENVFQIASCRGRIKEILIGCEDLILSCNGKRSKSDIEVMYSKSRVAAGARAYGISPIDSAFLDTEDPAGFEACLTISRQMGFGGGVAIAPRQVEVIHKVFSPSEAEIEHAKRVVAALEEAHRMGKGSISLDGKMVDAPIAEMAHRVLETAAILEKEE